MFIWLIASETFELTAGGMFDGSPCSFESPPTSRRQASLVRGPIQKFRPFISFRGEEGLIS